jgi:hypothetical protein
MRTRRSVFVASTTTALGSNFSKNQSIFTFLLCWNRNVGVKGPGQMIAKMAWEQREENLVKALEQNDKEEPERREANKK